MKHIVFDLEFNCPRIGKKGKSEIIEIGAVKLDSKLNVIGTFKSLVKPVRYPKLNKFVRKKTGISQSDLDRAETFPDVIARFRDWIGQQGDYRFCTWGKEDLTFLKGHCKNYKIPDKWLCKNYSNVQSQLSGMCCYTPGGCMLSLKNAVKAFKIPDCGKRHRALADALYTAEIFIRMKKGEVGCLLRQS